MNRISSNGDLAGRRAQCLRDHARVLAVIRHHASAEHEPVPVRRAEQSLASTAREGLIGQSNRIAYDRAQEGSVNRGLRIRFSHAPRRRNGADFFHRIRGLFDSESGGSKRLDTDPAGDRRKGFES
jgi:hypothetical protein